MPSSKRSPINYAPAFGGGIFRAKSEIDGDLALLEQDSAEQLSNPLVVAPLDASADLDAAPVNKRTSKKTSRSNLASERTSVRTTLQQAQSSSTDERTDERTDALIKRGVESESLNRTNERTSDSSDIAANVQHAAPATDDPSDAQSSERLRVRHSFDIYRDQLLSLGDVQLARHRQTGRKPKLGDLVQEALDAFVARHEQRDER